MTDQVLGSFDGIWIAPGSPFRDLHGAIRAITFYRTRQVPRFSTSSLNSPIMFSISITLRVRNMIRPPRASLSRR